MCECKNYSKVSFGGCGITMKVDGKIFGSAQCISWISGKKNKMMVHSVVLADKETGEIQQLKKVRK